MSLKEKIDWHISEQQALQQDVIEIKRIEEDVKEAVSDLYDFIIANEYEEHDKSFDWACETIQRIHIKYGTYDSFGHCNISEFKKILGDFEK
jgi:hypothetical protein